MNLKNQPPIFVPPEHQREVEVLSKAALMDMVWDYAVQLSGGQTDQEGVAEAMSEFRSRRDLILGYRAKAPRQYKELKAALGK